MKFFKSRKFKIISISVVVLMVVGIATTIIIKNNMLQDEISIMQYCVELIENEKSD